MGPREHTRSATRECLIHAGVAPEHAAFLITRGGCPGNNPALKTSAILRPLKFFTALILFGKKDRNSITLSRVLKHEFEHYRVPAF
jgi:hypothetical protein